MLRGAQLGMTDRYLRAKSLKRTLTAKADDVTEVLYTLWTESDAEAATALELVCVPFGDYDCRSFDDVVLDEKGRVALQKLHHAGGFEFVRMGRLFFHTRICPS